MRQVEWAKVRESFARADYSTIPLLLGLLVTFFWLKALRWKWLLEPVQKLSTKQVTPALMIGFMGNNVLPAHLGEFIRVFVLARQTGVEKTPILSTVVLERVFDVVVILALLGLSLFLIPGLPGTLQTLAQGIAVMSALGVLVLLAYVAFTTRFLAIARWTLARTPLVSDRLAQSLLGMLEAGARGLASVKDVRLLSLITLTSVLQWLINGAMIYVCLRSFDVQVSPLAALLVMGVTAFGVTVPSTPGYFGVVELCFMESLAPFGADEAAVLGASVYYHMVQYIPVTLTGLICLQRVGLSFGELRSEADAEAHEDSDNAASSEAEAPTTEVVAAP